MCDTDRYQCTLMFFSSYSGIWHTNWHWWHCLHTFGSLNFHTAVQLHQSPWPRLYTHRPRVSLPVWGKRSLCLLVPAGDVRHIVYARGRDIWSFKYVFLDMIYKTNYIHTSSQTKQITGNPLDKSAASSQADSVFNMAVFCCFRGDTITCHL